MGRAVDVAINVLDWIVWIFTGAVLLVAGGLLFLIGASMIGPFPTLIMLSIALQSTYDEYIAKRALENDRPIMAN